MVVVEIKMWPEGRENESREIGRIEIANDGTGSVDIGDYDVVVYHGGDFFGKPGAYKTGRVLRFVRRRGPYALLLAALEATVGGHSRPATRQSISTAPRSGPTKACNGCGRQILWTTTSGGKRMPLDPEPLQVVVDPRGDLRVVLEDGQVVAARRHEGTDMYEPTVGRASHFSTCPERERFRR